MDDRFTVDGGGHCLANLPMLQNRMSQIDSYVLKRGAWIRFNGGICVFLEPRKHVRLDVVLQKVDGSLFKFEHANHGIRNNFDNESRNLRPSFPIVGIGRQELSCSTAWSCLRSPRLGDWFFGSRIDS